jgi:hypothetical protein
MSKRNVRRKRPRKKKGIEWQERRRSRRRKRK